MLLILFLLYLTIRCVLCLHFSDLLNKEYHGDRKLKVTTKTANDVTFTTEGKMVNNASVLGSLSAKFKHSSGIRINKLAINTHGRVSGEVFMDDVVDGATVNVKFEDGNAGQNLCGKDYKQSGSVSDTAGVRVREKM